MDLSRLLAPRSIAVVGANDRAGGYADGILRNLARSGFDGPVWGVNPKREEVLGFDCFPSLGALPEPVDAVVVAIPAAAVPAVVAEAGALGCGGAVVVSANFGEVESGVALEAELREAALAHDLPVCGPNGNGIVAVRARAPMWGDSVTEIEAGPVAMVTQSGNVGVNALGSQRGIGWHTLVSTGNQAVCDASDWLGALAESDGVRSVALFLESDGDGPRLAEALGAPRTPWSRRATRPSATRATGSGRWPNRTASARWRSSSNRTATVPAWPRRSRGAPSAASGSRC